MGTWGVTADNRNGSNGVRAAAGGSIYLASVAVSRIIDPARDITAAVAATIYGWGGASRVGPTTALPMGCRLRASLPLRHFPAPGR